MVSKLKTKISNLSYKIAVIGVKKERAILTTLGIGLLYFGSPDVSFAQGDVTGGGLYNTACDYLLGLIEGPFGALIVTGAGIGAIIASALGAFKTAWTLVVTAVGAFILRGYLTLFFAGCGGQAGAGGGININVGG